MNSFFELFIQLFSEFLAIHELTLNFQVWAYIRFPIGRGLNTSLDAVPIMARWQSDEDRRSISSRLGDVRRAIDLLDHEKVSDLKDLPHLKKIHSEIRISDN